MRQRIGTGVGRGAINNFVRIIQAKSDGVAVLQLTSFNFLAIDEQAAALAAILDVVLSGFGDNRSAITRDAAVGKLQMIAGFGAPSDKEGHLCDANISPCAIGRNDLQDGLS